MPLIYIAEDDPGIRELILYTLQVSGFEAKGFETGTALLEAVQGTRPDLVMLDIMMPGHDGLTVLQKLRQNPGRGTCLPSWKPPGPRNPTP